MQKLGAVRRALDAGELDIVLSRLKYGGNGRDKVANVLEGFARSFDVDEERPVVLCSAPGRTEICGNHTDHQRGRVLAGAVDLDFLACASPNGTDRIRFQSEGWPLVEIGLDELLPKADERETTAALVRGMAGLVAERGYKVAGFDAYAVSEVLPGSGLSSSAAFEVLIGRILNGLFADNVISDIEIAQIGQYAKNVYYGKPSGLMDQMASSVGGLVFIDFNDPKTPIVEKVDYDFAHSGYTLCTIDSGADHADLTDEYAAMPIEMKKVAKFFGKEVLREVDEQEFYAKIAEIRKETGDRAVLRAIHFFNENRRVQMQVRALKNDNFDAFLHYVNESGMASWTLLQNVTPAGYVEKQDMAFTIALCQQLLGGEGAVRVHGGGFAGTALAFVPNNRFEQFKDKIDAAIGVNAVHKLIIQ